MNDPFALDLTIILLLLGVGAAMVAGNIAALLKSNKEGTEIFFTRTIFLNNCWSCNYYLVNCFINKQIKILKIGYDIQRTKGLNVIRQRHKNIIRE